MLDWSDMFLGAVILFALGLNVVALQGGSFVDHGAGDICALIYWVWEQHFLAGV